MTLPKIKVSFVHASSVTHMEEEVDFLPHNGIYRKLDIKNGNTLFRINVVGLDLMLARKVLFTDLEFSLNYGDKKATIFGENG